MEKVLPLLADSFPKLTFLNMTACKMTTGGVETVCKWVGHPAFKFPRAVLSVEMLHQNMIVKVKDVFRAAVRQSQNEAVGSIISFKL